MNGLLLLTIALAYFAAGYAFYGGYLNRLFGIDDRRSTPSETKNDGVDYVPTSRVVLFGHHFSSIAGAGPIVGPIAAAYFGWLPALLWILLGCVFIGAVHDFASLFLSVRHGGRSIGYVIERLMGYAGRQMFLIFCWVALILVVAIFGLMVAGTFVKTPAVATASVIFILMAPVFGYVSRNVCGLKLASLIFVPLSFLTVWFSGMIPIDLVSLFIERGMDAEAAKSAALWSWMGVLGVYVMLASVISVKWLLQPRDYLSSFLLYAMILGGVLGICCYAPDLKFPAFTGYNVPIGNGQPTDMIPALFILVACGACSGFHSLVASGTTSKQIRRESHIQTIGYGGMIVEGILGVMSLISVAYLSQADFAEIAANPVHAFASGIGVFMSKMGLSGTLASNFISLAISAFMLTTLDTATRLTRFVWQELFTPSWENREKMQNEGITAKKSPVLSFITNIWVASILSVVLAGLMASTGSANSIWPIFGASNQLLAALTLLGVSMYLMTKKLNFWVTLLPTALMMLMSIWGLSDIIKAFVDKNLMLAGAAGFLIVMALLLVALSVIMLHRNLRQLYGKGEKPAEK